MTDLFRCPVRFDPNHHFAHYTNAKALKGMLGYIKCVERSKMCMFATSIPCLYDQDELKTGEKYAPSIKGLNKDAHKNTYTISLCRNYNSRYMWEKYSEKEKHIGVILLLNTSKMNVSASDVCYEGTDAFDKSVNLMNNPLGQTIELPEHEHSLIVGFSRGLYATSFHSNTKPSGHEYKYEKEEEHRVTVKSDIEPCCRKDAENRDVYYIKHKFDKNALIEVIVENDSDNDLIDLLDKNEIDYRLKEDFDKQFSVG